MVKEEGTDEPAAWDRKSSQLENHLPFARSIHKGLARAIIIVLSLAGAARPQVGSPGFVFGAVADGDEQDGVFTFGAGREEAGHVVQRMSSFFSTWAKSLSLVAREALRWAARAAAKQSV